MAIGSFERALFSLGRWLERQGYLELALDIYEPSLSGLSLERRVRILAKLKRIEEALLLGERLLVMAPRPGRIHREYRLPFADLGVDADLRDIKKHVEYANRREEILEMIWNMEEEIMGRSEATV